MKTFNAVSEKNKKASVRCGDFESTVISIECPADFVEGDAYDIYYELTDANGDKFPYWERFFADLTNERTSNFNDYLESMGLSMKNIDNFVGTKEKISIRKKVSRNQARPTIISREVIK